MATIAYMVHDAASNTETQLETFDPDAIRQIADKGFAFVAIDEDGTRSVVPASEVTAPQVGSNQEVTFVMPKYVDDRIRAVAEALDAVQALFDVKSLAKLIKGDTDPLKTLKEKADALKTLLPDAKGDE